MNVLVVQGSPRKKGNSATLAATLADTLAENGGQVTTCFLNDLNYKGCQACEACKTGSDTCVIQDDLAPVLADFQLADVVILATPVYWAEVSAQMKGMIDRLYSFLTPNFMSARKKHRLPPGKQLVFIQTQGAPEEDLYDDIFERYNSFFKQIGFFKRAYLLRCCGVSEAADVSYRPESIAQARLIARQICTDRSR